MMDRRQKGKEEVMKMFDGTGGRLYYERNDDDEEEVEESGGGSAKFNELALTLVAALKSLMVYANEKSEDADGGEEKIKLRDKDIEARLRVIREVLTLGALQTSESRSASVEAHRQYQLPLNISISIMQTTVNLLTNASIVPLEKDFLILQISEVLQLLFGMHPDLVHNESAVYHTLTLVKWIIHLVRDRARQTNDVWSAVFGLLATVTKNMDGPLAVEMLPQVSSVATKVITDDFKHGHGIKAKTMDIWYNCLEKYFKSQASKYQLIEGRKFKLIDLKSMKKAAKQEEQDDTKKEEEAPETIERLAGCFKYIYENAAKLQANVSLVESFQEFCLKVMTTIPQISQSVDAVRRSELTYYVLACYALSLVKHGVDRNQLRIAKKKLGLGLIEKVTQASSGLPKQVTESLFKQLNALHKIKSMACMERRTHALQQTVAASVLSDMLNLGQELLEGSPESRSKLNVFIQNLIGLIQFDSQRFLIQEVDKQRILNTLDPIQSQAPPIPKSKAAFGARGQLKSREQIRKDNRQMKEALDGQVEAQKKKIDSHQNKIVIDYFDRAINLFQDDHSYSSEFRNSFMVNIAFEVRHHIVEAVMERLEQEILLNLDEKEHSTAKNLQRACAYLYILALVLQNTSYEKQRQMAMNQSVLERVQEMVLYIFTYDGSLDFNIRFPIQERYYACLFLLIVRLTDVESQRLLDFRQQEMAVKTKIFTLMFTGLSSQFDILRVLSLRILKNLCVHHGIYSASALQSQSELCTQLLQLDGSFFFDNLVTRLQLIAHEEAGTRSLSASRHLFLVLKSLSIFAPNLLAASVKRLLKLTYQSIDSAMIAKNQPQLLVCVNICLVLTEFVSKDQAAARAIERAEGLVQGEKKAAVERAQKAQRVTETATFGAGCYWGVQKLFHDKFERNGDENAIVDMQVGFMSADESIHLDDDPSYEQLQSGELGHVEVLQITFDKRVLCFEQLCRFFFQAHDPTTFGYQGADIGQQYQSTIFHHSSEQEIVAEKIKQEMQAAIESGQVDCFQFEEVSTQICGGQQFYLARQDDQRHLQKNPGKVCGHKVWFEWPREGQREEIDEEAGEKEKDTKSERVEEDRRKRETLLGREAAEKNIVNIMRRIILRLRPYMNSGTSPELAYKSIQIYENLIPFLVDRSMTVESKAQGNFSSEDGNNVLIPCCLAATTFEIYESFREILDTDKFSFYQHRQAKHHTIQLQSVAQKIKLLEALSTLVQAKPEFVLGMGRLSEDILPLVRIHLDLKKDMTEEETLLISKLKKNEKQIELRRVEQFTKMDWKLARAMRSFLAQCQAVRDTAKLEDVDRRRFVPAFEEIEAVVAQIDMTVDVTNEKVLAHAPNHKAEAEEANFEILS